jgi:hypothetical protein
VKDLGNFFVKNIYYFERPGPVNTEKTIELSKQRAIELGVDSMVVASLTGETALKAALSVRDTGIRVVCVTFRAGDVYNVESLELQRHWREIPELVETLNQWKSAKLSSIVGVTEEMKKKLSELGVIVVTSTDLAYNLNASLSESFGIRSPVDIIERTFRFLVCPGFKVCIFTTMTATDAGAISTEK